MRRDFLILDALCWFLDGAAAALTITGALTTNPTALYIGIGIAAVAILLGVTNIKVSSRAHGQRSGRVYVITGDPEVDASQLKSTLRRQMSRRYSA